VEGQDSKPYAKVTMSSDDKYKMLYYMFGGLWCHAMTGAFGQFVIASACCIWYFS